MSTQLPSIEKGNWGAGSLRTFLSQSGLYFLLGSPSRRGVRNLDLRIRERICQHTVQVGSWIYEVC